LPHSGYRNGMDAARCWLPYGGLALLLMCGTGLPNLAMAWVQYPVKVVIKSSKLVVAMAMSTALGQSRAFSKDEYLTAATLCAANAMFSFGAGRQNSPPALVVLGMCMLLAAAVCDVAAVNAQQWMMHRHNVAPMSLMLRQNFISFLGSCALLFSGGGLRVFDDPVLVLLAALVGFFTGLMVWGNTHLINEAGSVPQVALSSVRKAATIVLSYSVFPKPVTAVRALAGLLVAGSLYRHAQSARPTTTPQRVSCTSTSTLKTLPGDFHREVSQASTATGSTISAVKVVACHTCCASSTSSNSSDECTNPDCNEV